MNYGLILFLNLRRHSLILLADAVGDEVDDHFNACEGDLLE